MVKQIEEFSPEIHSHTITEWQREVLDDREIGVHKTWAVGRSPRGIAEFACSGISETLCVEPLAQGGVVSPGATKLIWADKVIPVVGQVHARTVVTRDNEDWESGSGLFDHVDLPISEDRIRNPVPVAPELLASPERQIIEHTSSEVVIQLYLREAPISTGRAGQWPVGHARAAAKTVVESRVEVPGLRVAQEDIQSVPRAFRLTLNLKRIVASRPRVRDGGDSREWPERGSRNSTAKSVAGDHSAGTWGGHIQVTTVHQNTMAAGTSVSGGQYEVAR